MSYLKGGRRFLLGRPTVASGGRLDRTPLGRSDVPTDQREESHHKTRDSLVYQGVGRNKTRIEMENIFLKSLVATNIYFHLERLRLCWRPSSMTGCEYPPPNAEPGRGRARVALQESRAADRPCPPYAEPRAHVRAGPALPGVPVPGSRCPFLQSLPQSPSLLALSRSLSLARFCSLSCTSQLAGSPSTLPGGGGCGEMAHPMCVPRTDKPSQVVVMKSNH